MIEEFLAGEEVSFFALVDGAHALPLATAQDHKAVGDGDTGPNTGGMGAYSPAPIVDAVLSARIMDEIIRPTVRGMAEEGTPFAGVLFAGLMIGKDGPKTLEFNVRFGDPECQVLMTRLKSDILPALVAAVDGQLAQFDLRWSDDAAVVVVMAAKGYPGAYQKGTTIGGLDEAAKSDGVTIFHAGTAAKDGKIVATGGRVLGIAATGKTVTAAQKRAYRAVDEIVWPEGFCRRDIGWRAVARETTGSCEACVRGDACEFSPSPPRSARHPLPGGERVGVRGVCSLALGRQGRRLAVQRLRGRSDNLDAGIVSLAGKTDGGVEQILGQRIAALADKIIGRQIGAVQIGQHAVVHVGEAVTRRLFIGTGIQHHAHDERFRNARRWCRDRAS